VVTATVVGVTLTPIFEKLPLNVLAAIVISGVLGLLDCEEAMYLYKRLTLSLGVRLVHHHIQDRISDHNLDRCVALDDSILPNAPHHSSSFVVAVLWRKRTPKRGVL